MRNERKKGGILLHPFPNIDVKTRLLLNPEARENILTSHEKCDTFFLEPE
jgi:hypothetical protein